MIIMIILLLYLDDIATKVYEHNFKGEKVKRVNLETITLAEIERHSAKVWLLVKKTAI